MREKNHLPLTLAVPVAEHAMPGFESKGGKGEKFQERGS